MMVSKVRGRFGTFSGRIVTGDDVTGSSVTATVESASVDTGNERRDKDLRSAAFLDVVHHPLWTFRSTGVRLDGGGLVVDGDLTVKGVTRPVSLAFEVNGIGPDQSGGTRVGISAETTVNRSDFGVTVNLRSTAAASWSVRKCKSTLRSRHCCARRDSPVDRLSDHAVLAQAGDLGLGQADQTA
jgi:polyisoprenoid-binding protein YceI